MFRALALHPNCSSHAVRAVEAEAVRAGGELHLRYWARGRMSDLLVPAPAAPDRTDGLWRGTCFEAFVMGADGRYCEFNLAPSSQWAAYAFDGYRVGMRPFEMDAPDIDVRVEDACLMLEASVTPGAAGPWRVGLCAVIEEAGGAMSYWALKHPPGKPDFHHADGFVLETP